MAKLLFALLSLSALCSVLAVPDPLVVAGFGASLLDQIANQTGFFEEVNLAPTFPFVAGSDQQFDNLDAGVYDLVASVGDNVIYRRLNLGRERYTVFAERDNSPGLWLLSRSDKVPTLEEIEGKTILTDSPVSGFVTAMRYIFQQEDIPLVESNLIPSGGLNQRIALLIAGTANATMSIGAISFAAVANNALIIKLADTKDYICPYLGTQIIGTYDWASVPANRDKLVRFLRAELKAYAYAIHPDNKADILSRIQAANSVDATTAELIYNETIKDPDTGFNQYLIPRMRSIANGINIRADDLEITRAPCLPMSAELVSKQNGWVDVGPLNQAAGVALNFWNVYGLYYNYPLSPCEQ